MSDSAELERLLAEPSPAAALGAAVRAGVFRLLDPRWRPVRATTTRLAALDDVLRWASEHRIAPPLTVAALVLATDQPPAVAATLTPGPAFLLASRVSMTLPRKAALRVVLGIASSVVLWMFGGSISRLIPLYAFGVFSAFTLSQAGMVRYWRRVRGPRWQYRALVNGVGATKLDKYGQAILDVLAS